MLQCKCKGTEIDDDDDVALVRVDDTVALVRVDDTITRVNQCCAFVLLNCC